MSSSTNILFLCRLCGTETQSQCRLNIFDNTGVQLNIQSKITNCLGFDVSENDYLPKVLCTECVVNLEKFNEFKIKSNKTALYLIGLLTKHISVNDHEFIEPKKQINSNQITYNLKSISSEPKSQIQSNPSSVLTSKNPSIFIQLPPAQLSNVQNPPTNVKKMVFQCNICKDVFQNHDESIEHVNTVHTSKNIVQMKVNTEKSKTVTRKKKSPKEYKCVHCPLVVNSGKELRVHLLEHSDNLYDCKTCGKKLKNSSTLAVHMKIHGDRKNDFVCNYCGKRALTKFNIEVHIRCVHIKECPFHCPQCDKKFSTKGGLKGHIVSIHNDICNYTCEICSKSFKTISNLNSHRKTHLPIDTRQNFSCNLCDASFVNHGSLKRHMYGHTGELKYGCDHCDKRYKDRSGLKVHLLTHTGEKNHVCDFCGKAFAIRNNLIDHRRIHTGERPFQCDLCQKTFTQKSALNVHRKKSCSRK